MSTKKDFEMTARILLTRKPGSTLPGEFIRWVDIVVGFADEYASQNARFDRKRFFIACGMKHEV